MVSITAGFGHTCALRAGGTVSCWGVNSRGELGDGTTTDRVTPTPVPGIGGAVALSSRSRSSCVLLVGGTVRCWGENLVGQLGNGTTSLASPPVTVSGLSGATSISVGDGHSCALLAGGSARCWGIGVLGDGAVSSSATQVAVLGLADAVSISAGGVSCALLADGTVRCWGSRRWARRRHDRPAGRRDTDHAAHAGEPGFVRGDGHLGGGSGNGARLSGHGSRLSFVVRWEGTTTVGHATLAGAERVRNWPPSLADQGGRPQVAGW